MFIDAFTKYMAILGRTESGKVHVPLLSTTTHGLITISYADHEVREGMYFRGGMNYTLANGNVAAVGFVTPDSDDLVHITWNLTATANGTFTVLEDVTSLAGGASFTPLNHFRDSKNTSKTTCTRGMTGVAPITPTGGTTILNATLGTGRGSTVDRSTGQPFILKKNSIYLFRYTNGTSANIIQLAMEWYEKRSMKE